MAKSQSTATSKNTTTKSARKARKPATHPAAEATRESPPATHRLVIDLVPGLPCMAWNHPQGSGDSATLVSAEPTHATVKMDDGEVRRVSWDLVEIYASAGKVTPIDAGADLQRDPLNGDDCIMLAVRPGARCVATIDGTCRDAVVVSLARDGAFVRLADDDQLSDANAGDVVGLTWADLEFRPGTTQAEHEREHVQFGPKYGNLPDHIAKLCEAVEAMDMEHVEALTKEIKRRAARKNK